ncbi:MAG: Na+-dependent transporter [Chlamydiae bacterium SM23_39]|nr:MAG: Na+-dependent transporter [Chlamydiae bacterium SM23_39]
MKEKRESFKSTLGFILATSGAAIGLGNIQRFPFIVSEGGGALFVFIYLICVILIGIPLILVEVALGRHTKRNPVSAINMIRPKSFWRIGGALGVLTVFFILTYYSVIAGWAIGYIFNMLFNVSIDIKDFSQNAFYSIGYMSLFLIIVVAIVIRGVHKGIERWSKILMPLLFIIILILVVRSLLLPNSLEGLKYYLKPDFSEVNTKIFLLALGQAFFSLSIGGHVLITYGSYAKKTENLVRSSGYVALFDTLIALLAGLVIFPAVFSFGELPSQGIALSFVVLPKIFLQMPLGNIFGAFFFLLLAFAAITSGIALLEIPVIYFVDSKKWSRKKAVLIIGVLVFLLGIPSALSQGSNRFLSNMKIDLIGRQSLLDIMDFVWGNFTMVLAAGIIAIFVGWVWGIRNVKEELAIGSYGFKRIAAIWGVLVKYIIPVLIFVILLMLFI